MSESLLATCWTHAGNASPHKGHLLSPENFEDRVAAVATAGFCGIGFLMEDLAAARDRLGYPALKKILDDNGMARLELEFIEAWWTRDAAALRYRREILQAAEELGVHHVKASPSVDFGRGAPIAELDLARWAEELHLLGEEAAAHGTRIALEFLPMSNVPDIATAMELVTQAGHSALGLCVDIWHVERGTSTLNDVAALPLERIVAVELDDAPSEIVGTMFEDTVDRRVHCGAGTFDLQGFIGALRKAGFHGPWGVEILSAQHRQRPLSEAVQDAHLHAARQLTL